MNPYIGVCFYIIVFITNVTQVAFTDPCSPLIDNQVSDFLQHRVGTKLTHKLISRINSKQLVEG